MEAELDTLSSQEIVALIAAEDARVPAAATAGGCPWQPAARVGGSLGWRGVTTKIMARHRASIDDDE
jgi:hypothetical protein